MLQNEQVYAEIAKAFSPKNVAGFLPLKGTELDNFISRYTPNIKVYTDNNFNLADYLNTCYKKFMQLTANQRQVAPDSTVFHQ